MQIASANGTTGLWFLPSFVETVDTSTMSYGAVFTNNMSATRSQLELKTGNATDAAYVDLSLDTLSTGDAESVLEARSADGITTRARLAVKSFTGAGGRYVAVLDSPFWLAAVTADDAALLDGMLWYRSDTDKVRLRANGATENLATETYVTNNAGILATIVDAKGDIIAATAADTVSRLAVGADATVLTADSSTGTGLKWAASTGATVKTEQMITPISWCSLGVQLSALSNGTATSQTWPTANKALYFPFTLDESTTFTKAFWMNGATVSGNVDIGIYNEAGTRQVSMGSTAQATINSIQEVNIADTTLAAGRYYMALSCDNTTATFYTWLLSSALYSKVLGAAEQTTAFVLPASFTLATPTTANIPVFGFSIRTLVV
jgi:hypothetical protein